MLVMVGFAIVFILPVALLFFAASNNELGKASVVQAKATVHTIADEASEVYLQGKGGNGIEAKKEILVNFPQGKNTLSLEGDHLVVLETITPDNQKISTISSTFARLKGDGLGAVPPRSGLARINLKYSADDDWVEISYAS